MSPTSQKLHPSCVRRNTGKPTTNQTSREAKRKIRAPARMFTARLLENICENFALAFGRPRSPRMSASTVMSAVPTRPMRIPSAVWKPTSVSSSPPAKNPTPFSAFFEPVRIATQR